MTDYCKQAIEKTGRAVSVTTPEGTVSGLGVITPVRSTAKKNGGVYQGAAGISEPQRFYLFTDNDTAAGARRGDSVSDGENEYYVLWTDSFDTVYGGYTKICMQLKREGRTNELLSDNNAGAECR